MPAPDPIPDPKADHTLPSHFATQLALVAPPAVVKLPPAYRSLPNSASPLTSLFTPNPKADQAVPSHFATRDALLPPALVKAPPAYTLLPDTAKALTAPP